MFPLYHVLADLGEWQGGEVVPVGSSAPLAVEALAETGGLLPDDRVDVRLEQIADTKRRVVVAATGRRSAPIVEELRSSVAGA